MTRTSLTLPLVAFLLGGCASFNETHYFVHTTSDNGKNYLKLQVIGSTAMSSARYVSGYFDPQAIDLYFNEMRGINQDSPDRYLIKNADGTAPTSTKPLVGYSLDSGKPHGDLVMILSTNATAVTDTIGAFSESNSAAQAISYLVNRPMIERYQTAHAQATVEQRQRVATKNQLNSLVAALGSSSADASDQYVLEILNVIANALGHTSGFVDYQSAADWIKIKAAAEDAK